MPKLTVNELNYLAGFFDADGSVCVYRATNNRCKRGYAFGMAASVSQKWPAILKAYQQYWSGTVCRKRQWAGWTWNALSRDALRFLQDIAPYLALKKAEAKIAIEFQLGQKLGRQYLTNEDFASQEAYWQQMKQLKLDRNAIMISSIPTNLHYLAGFFDGDGCICIAKTVNTSCKRGYYFYLVVDLGQKCPAVPYAYQRQWLGSIHQRRDRVVIWHVGESLALAFLKDIAPYLRLKQAEARLAIQFQQAKYESNNLTDNEFVFQETCHRQMKQLKLGRN